MIGIRKSHHITTIMITKVMIRIRIQGIDIMIEITIMTEILIVTEIIIMMGIIVMTGILIMTDIIMIEIIIVISNRNNQYDHEIKSRGWLS